MPTDVNSTLRVGETLVPVIIMSDGTHLSNIAGNKSQWPVYMTMGNLSSTIRQMPSTHSVVKVTLLPIPNRNLNNAQKRLDEQRQTNRKVLSEVLWHVFQPLIFKQNPSAESRYYIFLCADGNFGHCYRFWQQGLQITLSIATYIISSGMSVIGASVQRTNLEIISFLTYNTPGGITTYVEQSTMPTPRRPMPNSDCAMFTEDSTFVGILHVS